MDRAFEVLRVGGREDLVKEMAGCTVQVSTFTNTMSEVMAVPSLCRPLFLPGKWNSPPAAVVKYSEVRKSCFPLRS